MILLGVLVTTTGSGQGCGNSWPFCHGEIIPGTLTIAGVIEYSHRFAASVDGALVLVLVIWSWLTYRRDFRIKLYAFLSILFILVQGALGALTVGFEGTFALNWILSVHFGLSLIALASVVLLSIRLFQVGKHDQGAEEKQGPSLSRMRGLVWGLAIYTYIVVYTGALVEHTGAVTGCGVQIPACTTYLPDLGSLGGIQILHRYAAGLLWFLVLALLIVIMRNYRQRRDLVIAAWWSWILITLQAISGAFNVLTQGQMLAALVHATLISVFFSVICYLCAQVSGSRRNRNVLQEKKSQEPVLETIPGRS